MIRQRMMEEMNSSPPVQGFSDGGYDSDDSGSDGVYQLRTRKIPKLPKGGQRKMSAVDEEEEEMVEDDMFGNFRNQLAAEDQRVKSGVHVNGKSIM